VRHSHASPPSDSDSAPPATTYVPSYVPPPEPGEFRFER
jgi:hypothetical protein